MRGIHSKVGTAGKCHVNIITTFLQAQIHCPHFTDKETEKGNQLTDKKR